MIKIILLRDFMEKKVQNKNITIILNSNKLHSEFIDFLIQGTQMDIYKSQTFSHDRNDDGAHTDCWHNHLPF